MKNFLKILLIIIFWPIAVPIVIWKSKKIGLTAKIALTMVVVFFFLMMTVFKPKNLPQRILTNIPLPTETQGPAATVAPEPTQEIIFIDGTHEGAYGREITINANTDMPNTFIAYFVPYGTYKVETTDKPWNQFNVYTEEMILQDTGYEEYADTNVSLIKPGESLEIEVPEGWYVKVSPNSNFTMYRIK